MSDTTPRRTGANIAAFVAKFPGLGEDMFVHEHDYNQAVNSRMALLEQNEQLRQAIASAAPAAQPDAEKVWVSRSLAERTAALFNSVDPNGQIAREWQEKLGGRQS